jgi:hypothetical protein
MTKEFENPELMGAGFAGNTIVHMDAGKFSEIQFISVGDKVLSRCKKSGEIAYRKVVKKFEHADTRTYRLWYGVNDRHGYGVYTLEATAEVPFWVQEKGWIQISDLQPGEVIASFDGAVVTVVDTCDEGEGSETYIYNLTVDGFQTYFVGVAGLWVNDT